MPFKKFNTYGKEEIKAASEVIKTGQLSNFIGEWGSNFYGGKKSKTNGKKICRFFQS